jgi:putative lipoic acid-binding regulatory protein
METGPLPVSNFPQRVPIKVIGRGAELDPQRIAELIQAHLGAQPAADLGHSVNQRGAFTSLTFWITLPDEHAELPLRTAIQALPGVVMQL